MIRQRCGHFIARPIEPGDKPFFGGSDDVAHLEEWPSTCVRGILLRCHPDDDVAGVAEEQSSPLFGAFAHQPCSCSDHSTQRQ